MPSSNASVETSSELLTATAPSKAGPVDPEVVAIREEALERVVRGEISAYTVRKLIGLSGVFVSRLVRDGRFGALDPMIARTAMYRRLAEELNSKRFAKRKEMIEPVFAQIEANCGYRRFSRRGSDAVLSEWRLICATHNLLKLRKLSPTTA